MGAILTHVRGAVSNLNLDVRIRTIAVSAAIALAVAIIAAPAAQAQALSVLHTFTGGQDGGKPSAGLTIDQAGNFYGTTTYGGAGYGTVFKLSHAGSGWTLSTLYIFQGGSDGAYPIARVLFGPDGALYGTTNGGGDSGFGTVFSLRPPITACRSVQCLWTETVLHRFTGFGDGTNPGYGDLAFDAAGNIYGTTYSGGQGGGGTVFKLTPSGGSWTESVLYSFSQSGNAGYLPYAGVVLDAVGNLYGTTLGGGINSQGVVFQLTHPGSSWMETVLHLFGGSNDGEGPYGTLIMDQQGNLYGSTYKGGSTGAGTVYELQPSGNSWTYSILADLPAFANEGGPTGALAMDAAGNLYATTYADGFVGAGNVFELTPSGGSWTYIDLHDFNRQDGYHPYGSVGLDAHGNIYGTTFGPGWGEVWELTP
jgi:uncharacterized repeat protein (TIGR03803 family)